MTPGGYISTAGHGLFLGFLFLGPGFEAEPLPMEDVQQVSVISEEDFLALVAPEPAPVTPAEPAALVEPEAPEEPEAPAAETPVAQPPAPEVEAPPPPDPTPVPPEPAPEAEVTEEVIIPPAPDVPVTPPAEVVETRPTPRPAPRVAPEPIAPPEPDREVAPEVREAALPQEEAEEIVEEDEQEAAAPEEATTETVTEAEEEEPSSSAVASSLRPRARPTPPTPAQAAPPEEDAAEEDPVAAALAEALAGAEEEPSRPTGPPLTSGERDALRVSVSRCWNVGSLSTDALMTTVILAFDMRRDRTPVNASIRLISASGGSAQAEQQAFEAARRAIIRCGASGFDLPVEKYDQWREIEMTFNPEQMRIR